MVHPQNWTKYDLNEDGASDSVCGMSEEQHNTFEALQFLEDLRARKRGGQEKMRKVRTRESLQVVILCFASQWSPLNSKQWRVENRK